MKTLVSVVTASLSAALLAACSGGSGSSSIPVASLSGAQKSAAAGSASLPSKSANLYIAPNRSIIKPEKIIFVSPSAPNQIVNVLGYYRNRSSFGGNCSTKNVALVSFHRFYEHGAKFTVTPTAPGRCSEIFVNTYGLRGTLLVFVRN
jgi:hypothetical protein